MYNQYRPPGSFGGPPPPPFGGPPAPAYGGQQFGGPPSYGQQQFGGPSSTGASKDHDDKLSKVKDPLLSAVRWLKTRSPKEKTILGCIAGFLVR